jgi:hypothetical protein
MGVQEWTHVRSLDQHYTVELLALGLVHRHKDHASRV